MMRQILRVVIAMGIVISATSCGGQNSITAINGNDQSIQYNAQSITRLKFEGGAVEVVFPRGELDLPRVDVIRWIEDSARAVTDYYGRFPVSHARINITLENGRGILNGSTYGYGGAVISITLGKSTRLSDLQMDWVLVHEMVHLAFPAVFARHLWASEGLATYVEPLVREDNDELTEETVWINLVNGLPQGLPKRGDRGLDKTPTWGRTYWGGALFYLLADIEIHKRTDNRRGLRDAIIAINAGGGNITKGMSLEQAFTLGDEATGVPVLMELYEEMKMTTVPVDLNNLWRRLGVSVRGHKVHFNNKAPLASVRRAITATAIDTDAVAQSR